MKPSGKDGTCPLCRSSKAPWTFHDRLRRYRHCECCRLIFVPSQYHLSAAEEKARYDKHRNHPLDEGYRKFLRRLFIPLQKRLKPGSHGLDFGSGPGPTLSVMFNESGYSMKIYDPFYAPDKSCLTSQYDFITATEVLEHLHRPGFELDRLWSLLQPGGQLGVMTRLLEHKAEFSSWYYKNDPTHVCFYSRKTFQWLALHWKTNVEFIDKDVILYRKPLDGDNTDHQPSQH